MAVRRPEFIPFCERDKRPGRVAAAVAAFNPLNLFIHLDEGLCRDNDAAATGTFPGSPYLPDCGTPTATQLAGAK